MHISPKSWAIPLWEQELRIRLWWMLSIHDGWMSFRTDIPRICDLVWSADATVNSRPSHMQTHNSTIPLPDKGAMLDAACTFASASSDSSLAFLTMCELSSLVHRLQRTCCTLGSVNRSSSARKDDIKTLYADSTELMTSWSRHIAGSRGRVTGVSEWDDPGDCERLNLICPGSMLVHLLGFRCMLMRLQLEVQHGLSSPFEPDSSNLRPFHDLVDFVQLLDGSDTDGYWLICGYTHTT